MQRHYSFIIPVYNRPEEIKELLLSFASLKTDVLFDIIIIEDGSSDTSEHLIQEFPQLSIAYYFKENTGPGDSRNFGMYRAEGNFFIILDSDVILPTNYLNEVDKSLNDEYADCFGGPDKAHESFSTLQKAINFAMTSFLTTGGIRGNRKAVEKFQPRSFNMGISKQAFIASKGFGSIHPGEDPDLSIRLWKLGFTTKLIPEAFVYHKRRVSWTKFYNQVRKFGLVRPILNLWHPQTKKITFWFPSLFILGLDLSVLLLIFGFKWLLLLYVLYFILILITAFFKTKQITLALYAVLAVFIQFFGYGLGFLESYYNVHILKKNPEKHFPQLFFNIEL